MAKIYGALEVAQLEWFTQSPDTRPSAASNTYRVIYASDVKQVQISDGTNWIAFINGSTNQTLAGNITFSGQQIFSGLHRLSVTTDSSSTGAITALNNVTPVIEFTAAVTSISGIANSASGATVMLVNRTGGTVAVLDEDAGATAANRIRTGTGAQISLANNASILLTYVGDSRWHVIGGSGSGSGSAGINYITNGSAEADTLGWAVYADAAGTSPVDGTGGSANVTITRSTTSPLIGTASFILTKDAANRQGQGWSYDFTIDSAYKAKVLQVSFQYLVDSGTFVAGSSSTDSDVTVWLYDKTNSLVIQPSSYKLLSNNASISDTFNATFQTASNSTSYRLIFHVGSTSTSAYALKVDGISVSPSTYVYGTPVTDWQSYTPTFTGFGTVSTQTFWWRRNGDTIQIKGRFAAGTSTATEARISLPFSLVSDSNKVNGTAEMCGVAQPSDINSSTTGGIGATFNVLIEPSQNYVTFASRTSTNGGLTKLNAINIATGGTALSLFAQFPILGWSSSVQTSDQTDTRVVAAQYSGNSGTSVTANVTNIPFSTLINDTHGSWNGSQYTAPVSGYYSISGAVNLTATNSSDVTIYKDSIPGQIINTSYASTSAVRNFNGFVYLNAGQVLSIRLSITSTLLNTASLHFININRLSGPSAIAASETVACRYTNTAGTSIGTGDTLVPFATRDYDTHLAYNGSVFTVPISGKYAVQCFLTVGVGGVIVRIDIYKGGSSIMQLGAGYSTGNTRAMGSTVIQLNAGEQISLYASSSSAGSLSTTAGLNHFSIVRVGN